MPRLSFLYMKSQYKDKVVIKMSYFYYRNCHAVQNDNNSEFEIFLPAALKGSGVLSYPERAGGRQGGQAPLTLSRP